MEYYIFFIVLFLCAFAEVNNLLKNKILFAILVFLLILFAGTRYKIGTDYMTYSSLFEICKEGSIIAQLVTVEALFVLLSNVAYSLAGIFLIYALIGVGGKGIIISKVAYPFTCLLMYYGFCYLFFDMGIMRQGAAIAVCLYSIKYIIKREPKKFIFLVFVCTTFIHRSSLFWIFAYFIKPTCLSKKYIYLFLAISFLLGFIVNEQILLSVLSVMPSFFSKFGNTIVNIQQESLNFGFTSLRKVVIILFLTNYLCKKLSHQQIFYKYLINIYFWGVCASLAFVRFPTLAGRGTYFYCVTEILLLPLCMKYIKNKFLKNLYFIGLSLYSFLYMRNVINNVNTDSWMNLLYLPYNSILYK